jgi:hypothetical protein
MNILRIFGSLKSCAPPPAGPSADGFGEVWFLSKLTIGEGAEDELGNAVFMGDIMGLEASIE